MTSNGITLSSPSSADAARGLARVVDGHRHRRRAAELGVRHEADHHRRHRDVEHGADRERAEDADRHVALRVAALPAPRWRRRRSRCRRRRSPPRHASRPTSRTRRTCPVFGGISGVNRVASTNETPAAITSSTTATFTTTITPLTVADSRTPRTSSAVTRSAMSTAGRLKIAVTVVPSGVASDRARRGADDGRKRDAEIGEHAARSSRTSRPPPSPRRARTRAPDPSR